MNVETDTTIETTINKDALSLFSDTSRYPYIPKALSSYIEGCVAKKLNNRLVNAVQGKKTKVFENVNRMFELASDATGLTPDELLRRTDFNDSDMSPTRLDSAFAEIRTINYLKEQGFVHINLLQAGKHKKADILATFKDIEFAIEVVNSIFSANKRVEPLQLKDWLIGRASSDEKTEQLEQTSKETSVSHTILIGVVDTFFSVVFNTHNDYCDAAKLAWEELNREKGFHVAFVTGREALGYGRDDCVFPELPG